MENTLKQKLAAGAQPIGTFFDTASVSLMECLGRTGLDFAIIGGCARRRVAACADVCYDRAIEWIW